ncbi:hypothetical protein SS50377_24954 [Spironucleus salmonicida]|uniref:Uncharacterized protein n=1 Tax=Spironucleus salmonicida TaxID=348837 RepID=A0A9P8RXK2_9EUKA|nr:hypothetical protein SS50377_24954 [Spironucleus salmonicida]
MRPIKRKNKSCTQSSPMFMKKTLELSFVTEIQNESQIHIDMDFIPFQFGSIEKTVIKELPLKFKLEIDDLIEESTSDNSDSKS